MDKELKKRLESAALSQPDELVNDERVRHLSLTSEQVTAVRRLHEYMVYFAQATEDLIDEQGEKHMRDQINETAELFAWLSSFNILGNDVRRDIDKIKSRINGLWSTGIRVLREEKFQILLSQVAPELERVTGEITAARQDANSLQEARAKYEKLYAETVEVKKQNQDLLERAGIGHFATKFLTQANEHKKASVFWLVLSTALIVGSVIGMYFFTLNWTEKYKDATTAQAVNLATTKLVIFSMLIGAVVWAGRLYSVNRHNYIINKHRHNALASMEAFKGTATDPATRNTVLLQVTSCIFSPQPTGYHKADDDGEGMPKIVEIMRNLPPETKN